MGDCKELSPQAKSDLGFDDFNYQLIGRFPPSPQAQEDLREHLVQIALNEPEALLFHVFHESLHGLVGPRFDWAVFGAVKTDHWSRALGASPRHAAMVYDGKEDPLTWESMNGMISRA